MMGHKFHLTLSGQGPAEHELRQHVTRLGLVSCVHFTSPIETMLSSNDAYKTVLQAVDIFVQPWPGTVWQPELLESMSVGNTVVIAEGTMSDLIINGKTALTVSTHDEMDLTETLDRLMKDRQYARKIAAQGQNYLRKHFLASRMVTQLAKAYRQAQQYKIPRN